jgi:hypothetical protein
MYIIGQKVAKFFMQRLARQPAALIISGIARHTPHLLSRAALATRQSDPKHVRWQNAASQTLLAMTGAKITFGKMRTADPGHQTYPRPHFRGSLRQSARTGEEPTMPATRTQAGISA